MKTVLFNRLLDVVPSDGRCAHEMVLHMVFEYMEQDLDSFIRHRSPCGIEIQLLKVLLLLLLMFLTVAL